MSATPGEDLQILDEIRDEEAINCNQMIEKIVADKDQSNQIVSKTNRTNMKIKDDQGSDIHIIREVNEMESTDDKHESKSESDSSIQVDIVPCRESYFNELFPNMHQQIETIESVDRVLYVLNLGIGYEGKKLGFSQVYADTYGFIFKHIPEGETPSKVLIKYADSYMSSSYNCYNPCYIIYVKFEKHRKIELSSPMKHELPKSMKLVADFSTFSIREIKQNTNRGMLALWVNSGELGLKRQNIKVSVEQDLVLTKDDVEFAIKALVAYLNNSLREFSKIAKARDFVKHHLSEDFEMVRDQNFSTEDILYKLPVDLKTFEPSCNQKRIKF